MAQRGRLEERLRAGEFVITAELVPPLGAAADELFVKAAPLRGLVDAVNVTDAAGARTAMSSFAAAALLVEAGFEPVLQVTCRDRNRIALAGDLLGAAAQGVKNLLILHGDDPAGGDQPEAKPVYDLDSREVMALARAMRDQGALPWERAVAPPPQFFIGAADIPLDPPEGWRPEGLAAKAEAGAQFVQTQFCFDLEVAERYTARLAEAGLTERLGVLVGVGPLASARSARWMNEHLFGVSVPESVIARLEGSDDEAAEGRTICIEMIEGLRRLPHVGGVHLMAPAGGPAAIASVIEGARLDR